MPLNKILQSLKGQCRYCGQNAGFLRGQHSPCRDLYATGIQEMTQLAAQAAGAHTFNESTLRQTLGAIAQRSRATPRRDFPTMLCRPPPRPAGPPPPRCCWFQRATAASKAAMSKPLNTWCRQDTAGVLAWVKPAARTVPGSWQRPHWWMGGREWRRPLAL